MASFLSLCARRFIRIKMKNYTRASFGVGLSKACTTAWWSRVEAIRTGDVPRKITGKNRDTIYVKQATLGKNLGYNRAHLGRILSEQPHDWSLLLLFVLDLAIDTHELAFPGQKRWMCHGYAESIREMHKRSCGRPIKPEIDEVDCAYLIALHTSDQWQASKKTRNTKEAEEIRMRAAPDISVQVRQWLGLPECRTRDAAALVALELTWGEELAMCIQTLPVQRSVSA